MAISQAQQENAYAEFLITERGKRQAVEDDIMIFTLKINASREFFSF